MTTTFRTSGNPLSLSLSSSGAAGTGVLVGSLFVIAADAWDAAVSTDPTACYTMGEFLVTKLSTDNPTVGAKLYWDDTNKRLTTTASGNTLVGVCTEAPAASATKVWVALFPQL